jgi:hypothetical protein
MSRALAFSFALSSLLGACVFEDDEDIWMPPGSNGKADGVQIIKGSTIPSQHVAATKDYLTGRSIDSLSRVGALPAGDDLEVAKRADGIIANLPANGRIEAAELARMESPQIFATLFPNEQAALPRLWPLLEAPSGAAMPVSVPGADLTVTDQSTQPGGLTPPASLAISALEAGWQQVARRVQLVFNGDGDATTIQTADIQSVLADPQAFTPAEVELLKAILAEFHRRATSFEEAKAQVPQPGTTTKHTQLGMMALDFSSEIAIAESRHISWSGGSWGSLNISTSMRVVATSSGAFSAPAGSKAILISLADGNEQVFEASQPQLASLAVGDYVLERYAMGARQETFHLALPGFTQGEKREDATRFLDYVLVTPGGATLVKNAVSTGNGGGNNHGAEFRHELAAHVYPGVDAGSVAAVATPWTALPSGRYETTFGSIKVLLDLYPQRVAVATISGLSGRLQMRGVNTQNPYTGFFGTAAGYNLQFSPNTNELIIWLGNQTPRVTLTPAHRTR